MKEHDPNETQELPPYCPWKKYATNTEPNSKLVKHGCPSCHGYDLDCSPYVAMIGLYLDCMDRRKT